MLRGATCFCPTRSVVGHDLLEDVARFSSGQSCIGTAETLRNACALPSRLLLPDSSHLLHPLRVSPSLAWIRVSAG